MKQYLKLLLAREGREVVGRRGTNLWLLTAVLVATFLSIAFSKGSMNYLRYKMEDPFTNWVNIIKNTNGEDFWAFRTLLENDSIKALYGYNNVLMDHYNNYSMMGVDEDHQRYLSTRHVEHINTPLIHAILDKSNLVDGCVVDTTLLKDNTMGFIISMDAARRLGYDEERLPSYIQFLAANDGADTLGLKLVDDRYPVSLPVLAVVKKLPNNSELMTSCFFMYQYRYNQINKPFDFNKHRNNYLHSLRYYVSDKIGLEAFVDKVRSFVPDSCLSNYMVLEDGGIPELKSWKPGIMVQIYLGEPSLPIDLFQSVADRIEETFDVSDVRRVFQLEYDTPEVESGDYISIEFANLDHIRDFEAFAKENMIQLDMAQVASKENFNAVTVMARILSGAMVVFSIVCIIMFMVNMLQAYFQKVKRNIGTFKAFGMNTNELIMVYIIILVAIVTMAVLLSLSIVWGIQGLLPCLGVQRDGFNYLSLWNDMTYTATAVIFVSTVVTVCVVMTNMLRQTPGDLIYDRN